MMAAQERAQVVELELQQQLLACSVPPPEAVTIRVVSCTEQEFPVRESLAGRFGYPSKFPSRCKTILMFQRQVSPITQKNISSYISPTGWS
jgi:hypothetical protein